MVWSVMLQAQNRDVSDRQ